MKKMGVTIIEAMLAVSIISVAIVSYMKFYQEKVKTEIIEEFSYDYKKVITAFNDKMVKDNFDDKEKWVDFEFDESTFQDHLKHNFISQDSKCTIDELGHVELEKNYIPCFLKLNMRPFNVKFKGEMDFYNDDSFKSYKITFTPKNKEGLQKFPTLYRTLKIGLNESDFYSDIEYYIKKDVVPYTKCVLDENRCVLKMSFGLTYNYKEDESDEVAKEISDENTNDSWNRFETNYDGFQDKEEDKSYETSEIGTIDDIRGILDDNNLDATDEEISDFQKQLRELRNNPEFMRQVELNMDLMCSRYDKDDYYFMSIHEQDNDCYQYMKNGIE